MPIDLIRPAIPPAFTLTASCASAAFTNFTAPLFTHSVIEPPDNVPAIPPAPSFPLAAVTVISPLFMQRDTSHPASSPMIPPVLAAELFTVQLFTQFIIFAF